MAVFEKRISIFSIFVFVVLCGLVVFPGKAIGFTNIPAPNAGLSMEPDYKKGIGIFKIDVSNSMYFTGGPWAGTYDSCGSLCVTDSPPPFGAWAKENLTVAVRNMTTGSMIWSWSSGLLVAPEGGKTAQRYTAPPFHLAAKTPGTYKVELYFWRSAIDSANYGAPCGNYYETQTLYITLDNDTFAPIIKDLLVDAIGTTGLVFRVRAKRFNGDQSDPNYDQPLSSNPIFKSRGNSIWVCQTTNYVVERKSDGVQVWSSGQDPSVPVGVLLGPAEEDYTSKTFNIGANDLSNLRVKATVTRYIESWEGLIGWHAATYVVTKTLELKPDLITNLSVNSTVFNPYNEGENFVLYYTLAKDAKVKVIISGNNGFRNLPIWDEFLVEYAYESQQKSGTNFIVWSGIIDYPEMAGYFGGGQGVFMATGGTYDVTIIGIATDGSNLTDTHTVVAKIDTNW